jgi:hypothetical protein
MTTPRTIGDSKRQAVEAPVSQTAIKPCPFCGGRGITHRASMPQQWAVSCTQCDCRPRIGWPTSEAEAIMAWNAREYDERLKRLELMRLDAMAMEDNAALVEQTIRSECDARQAEAMREALEGVTASLEYELNDTRGILDLFETEIEPDQEVIEWLGEAEGRKVIAAVLRLRKARAALDTQDSRTTEEDRQ